jgi:hypothetical protein
MRRARADMICHRPIVCCEMFPTNIQRPTGPRPARISDIKCFNSHCTNKTHPIKPFQQATRIMTMKKNRSMPRIQFYQDDEQSPVSISEDPLKYWQSSKSTRPESIPFLEKTPPMPQCRESPPTLTTESKPIPCPISNDQRTQDEIQNRDRLTEMYDMATWQMYRR